MLPVYWQPWRNVIVDNKNRPHHVNGYHHYKWINTICCQRNPTITGSSLKWGHFSSISLNVEPSVGIRITSSWIHLHQSNNIIYISTKNPTAVLSDFRHFPVACTTLCFFLSVGGLSSVILHLSICRLRNTSIYYRLNVNLRLSNI